MAISVYNITVVNKTELTFTGVRIGATSSYTNVLPNESVTANKVLSATFVIESEQYDDLDYSIEDAENGASYTFYILDTGTGLEVTETEPTYTGKNVVLTDKDGTYILPYNPNHVDTDLSNLSTAGQAVIDGKTNTDLSNITSDGETVIEDTIANQNKYVTLDTQQFISAAKVFGITNASLSSDTNQFKMYKEYTDGSRTEFIIDYTSARRCIMNNYIDGSYYTIGLENGNFYGLTPSTDSNSREVASTAWVRTLLDSILGSYANFSSFSNSGPNGYFILSNGLKFQWGWSSTHQTDTRYVDVTFPISFESTVSYIVLSTANYYGMANWTPSWVYSRATGSCVIASNTSNSEIQQWYIAIGN